MKHKHYDCIVAWANGEKIEVDYGNGVWLDVENTNWKTENNYRIKKEPVIEVAYFRHNVAGSVYNHQYAQFIASLGVKWDLKVTYEDGKAVKAELSE
jgi:hypothetical protein